MTTETQKLLYSVNEACSALGGISRRTFYRLVESGEFATAKIGAKTVVDATQLEAYVKRVTSSKAA